jgi:hypothetical protein
MQVYVWNYIEANYVINSVWNRSALTVANFMLPAIDDPPVDYVRWAGRGHSHLSWCYCRASRVLALWVEGEVRAVERALGTSPLNTSEQ